jgi:hypothetical protein
MCPAAMYAGVGCAAAVQPAQAAGHPLWCRHIHRGPPVCTQGWCVPRHAGHGSSAGGVPTGHVRTRAGAWRGLLRCAVLCWVLLCCGMIWYAVLCCGENQKHQEMISFCGTFRMFSLHITGLGQ